MSSQARDDWQEEARDAIDGARTRGEAGEEWRKRAAVVVARVEGVPLEELRVEALQSRAELVRAMLVSPGNYRACQEAERLVGMGCRVEGRPWCPIGRGTAARRGPGRHLAPFGGGL